MRTCDWHTWKFRLADGGCLRGEEEVRGYQVRLNGGGITERMQADRVAGSHP